MSAQQFKYLFSPIEIGPYTVKNRVMCAHHGPMMAEQGIPTDEYVYYEIEKAKGGAGWVAMSIGYNMPRDPMYMKPNGGHYDRQVYTWKKEIIPQMKKIADGVHEYGARVSFQWYSSSLGSRIGPSVVPDCNFGDQMWSAITKEDIEEYLKYMAVCAENLMEAGFDGVDVHNHSGWVADFLSATINKRTDEYGGRLENRARLLMETIDTLRKVVGPDKTIGYTLTVDDLLPGSIVPEDGVELMRMLDRDKKVDFIIAGIARETQTMHMYFGPLYLPPAYQLYAVEQVKEVAKNIPVIAVGRINDPLIAEQALAEGKCDMIAMARALIADPELPNKAREGRLDDIRPCMGCNLNCIKFMFQGVPIRCVANPTIGMEWQGWGGGNSSIRQAPEKKKVVVVGGGPSGMEAARVAALKGHDVTIYEKEKELGGQALLAERLPGREEMGGLIRWQKLQLPQAGVKVITGTEATAQMILDVNPDVVVVAAGSTWMRNGYFGGSHMEVAGWQQDNVYSADEIVRGITEGTLDIGKKAIIWDTRGDIIPRAVAELMADQGCQVELICPLPVALDLQMDVTYLHIMPRILVKGVKVSMETFLVMIQDKTATVLNIHTMETREITDIDTVVLTTGKIPNDQLYNELEGKVKELYKIGEARNPHDMGDANRDGHWIGRFI
ncbi:MAG: FAD-dependent oxidoreductase [Dehalococcoidia bacterium]|nr:MAG: FAD-dependent oxidoreductase [Dehalococcoidia bacterium]